MTTAEHIVVTENYNALLRLLESRHSCRSFAPDPVDEKAFQSLADAFALAPQAGGNRHLQCCFITDRTTIRDLAERGREGFAAFCQSIPSAYAREETVRYGENFFWFSEVPALAVVTCRKAPSYLQQSAGNKAPLIWGGELSAGMSAFSLLLAAEAIGLGACCLTGPLIAWREIEGFLKIPRRDMLILLVALGYKKAAS
ncbi:MAG: nitroreductase family protein [Betaproteobacteria bacterium]|nr:nitroreductase family protein [Betaproteobacteria bacterium]